MIWEASGVTDQGCQHGDQNRIEPRLLWPIVRCLLGLGMAVSLDGSGL
jgi:hypothetical protein